MRYCIIGDDASTVTVSTAATVIKVTVLEAHPRGDGPVMAGVAAGLRIASVAMLSRR